MSINTVVKLKFICLFVCLLNVPPIWHQMMSSSRRFFDVMASYIMPHCTKIEMRSLFGQKTSKCHIYVTPLQSSYFMSLHYKATYDVIPFFCIKYIESKCPYRNFLVQPVNIMLWFPHSFWLWRVFIEHTGTNYTASVLGFTSSQVDSSCTPDLEDVSQC